MGLCKCERKRVTNLFCFEHRVNVCEFCMVSSHEKCIVKSYLRWLKDCDFNPACGICRERFDESDKECIRLICLDVFHRECLVELLESAPPTTAPAGFVCPCCGECVIPQSNHGGPVAEALRTLLAEVRWSSGQHPDLLPSAYSARPVSSTNVNSWNLTHSEENHRLLDPRVDLAARQFLNGDDIRLADLDIRTIPAADRVSRDQTQITVSHHSPKSQRRELPHPTAPCVLTGRFDDEDKYKRRMALGGIFRVLKSTIPKYCMLVRLRRRRSALIAVLLFATVLLLLSTFGRSPDSLTDPLFDPQMNPNIHLDGGAAAVVRAGLNLKDSGIKREQ